MIQFFRRIRQKLLAQGRLSKYLIYALGEIALVMIGILLALQVNNWNQERNIKNIERTLLLDLRDEFKYNDSLIQTRINYADKYMAQMKEILYFTGPDVKQVTTSKMTEIIAGSSKNKLIYFPSTSVLDDVVNSGQLQYLTDKEIRRSLSVWQGYLKLSDTQEQVVESYRSSIKQLTIENSDMMTIYQLEKVFGLDSIDTGMSDFNFVYKELLSDRRFENLILYKVASTGSLKNNYLQLQSYMHSILQKIDEQIEDGI